MHYANMFEAVFVDRPNRFIANIIVNGEKAVCHVKNTGRCRELLIPGARIIVQRSDNPNRKTQWDLIKIYKGDRLINMDSNAPNVVFGEFLRSGGLGFVPELVKAEQTHGESRFDYYFEHNGKKAFAEVKGVTLEENDIARFPDAPTLRGIKHLMGLKELCKEGYDAYAVFVIQMRDIKKFHPAWDKHYEFGLALRDAAEAGVKVLAYECEVSFDGLEIIKPVELDLNLP